MEEGCVLEAVVDCGVDVDGELTTTTGFTRVVVLIYWAFTIGICATDLRIGVVIILPARLEGARIWAVTWFPCETTVIGVTIGVRPERGVCGPTIWAIPSVDGAFCITVEPGLPVVVWSDTPAWLSVNPATHRGNCTVRYVVFFQPKRTLTREWFESLALKIVFTRYTFPRLVVILTIREHAPLLKIFFTGRFFKNKYHDVNQKHVINIKKILVHHFQSNPVHEYNARVALQMATFHLAPFYYKIVTVRFRLGYSAVYEKREKNKTGTCFYRNR